jgi:hypothetical protein
MPNSIHPSGEEVEWYADGDPAQVDGGELKRALARCASAALIARHWPGEGGRHEAALTLDGFLTRVGFSTEERQNFLEAVVGAARDDEPRDRVRVADHTENRLADGKRVSGAPKLETILGKEVVKKLVEWLEYPGWELEEALERMNKEYAVVMDGSRTRVLRFDPQVQTRGDGRVVHRRLVPNFLSFGDFYNFHLGEYIWVTDNKGKLKPTSIGVWWAKHPQRRKYAGIIFRPDTAEVVDGRLNLWRGWGVEPAKGDWSLMMRHIVAVLAAGDEASATYILNWLAWAVQHPAERAQVALVFKGGRGTGKGTVGNAMCRIFGQHATHISSVEHLAGRFNAHLRDACLLFADEAYWPGDKRDEGTLKRLITEPTLFIEAKGRDGVTAENMLHVMMASNSDWIVPAGEHERRYAIFQVSEEKRQDESWFTPLYEQLENGGYAAMLYDLLRRDLGDWHPRRIPFNDALLQQQVRNLEPLDAWVLELFETGELPEGEGVDRPDRAISRSKPDFDGRNHRNGWFDLARDRVPALRRVNDQVLAARLKTWGCTPWRNNQVRGWQFPPLLECRARWEQKYPEWKWQHPDLVEWQVDDNTGPNW